MARIPVGTRLVLAASALLAVAQVACASPGDPAAADPQIGEVSIVFPQNDTYAVVSPFPVIFGYQNAPALLSYNSELRWNIECKQGALFGSDSISGHKYAEVPSGDYYILNSTETLQDSLPDNRKDPEGPYGRWLGEESPCVLTWEFFYWTICTRQPNDATLIQSGVGKRKGEVRFTLRPGAKLPKDAIADYQGCAVKGTIEKITNSSTACPDLLTQPEAQPCKLDVKVAASSLAAAAVSPTTSFTGKSTSTQGTSTTEPTSGSSSSNPQSSGSGKGNGDGGSSSSTDDGKSAATGSFDRHSLKLFVMLTGGTCLFNHLLEIVM